MQLSTLRRAAGRLLAIAGAAALLVGLTAPGSASAAVLDPAPTATLSGDSLMAQQMTVTTTGWPTGTTLSYQWLRDGELIADATSDAYFPGFADYRAVLTVRVTGTGEWGTDSIVSDGSAPITSEDDATIVIGALTPEDGLVEGADVYLFSEDRLLHATASTSARGVAIFQGLPEGARYGYTLFHNGSIRAMGHQIEVRSGEETLRRVVVTPGLQKDSHLEGAFSGSNGDLGVFAGPKVFALDGEIADGMRDDNQLDDLPMESAELRLSVTDGDNQFANLTRNGSDWITVLDLDQLPQLTTLGVFRTYGGGEQYATFFDLAVVTPSIVADQWGTPLSGAAVTLEVADSPEGPFLPVDADDLHYATNRNPASTDDLGRFGFLVTNPSAWFRATTTIDGVTAHSAVAQGQFAADALSIVVDIPGRPNPAASGQLAATGADVTGWPAGALLLLLGAALLVARRTRRRATH